MYKATSHGIYAQIKIKIHDKYPHMQLLIEQFGVDISRQTLWLDMV
jgi:hypothetical protein